MARSPFGARDTCESCKSIDVRRWHREGRLRAGQHFSWSWTCGGEPSGTIKVRTEGDAVVLIYRARSLLATEWKPIEQRVPITDCGISCPATARLTVLAKWAKITSGKSWRRVGAVHFQGGEVSQPRA
jgi:hypothetical protein